MQPNRAALSYPESMVVFGSQEEAFHRQTGLPVIPYSAQGKGFFSKLEKLVAKGLSATDHASFCNETNSGRWPRVKQLAEKYAVPVSHIALSYLSCHPFVTIPVIGCRTLDQLRDSTGAADLVLTQEEIIKTRSCRSSSRSRLCSGGPEGGFPSPRGASG